MRRYRVVFVTTPVGGFHEFSAENDRQARAHVVGVQQIHGRAVSLWDVTDQYARPSNTRVVEL